MLSILKGFFGNGHSDEADEENDEENDEDQATADFEESRAAKHNATADLRQKADTLSLSIADIKAADGG